MKTIRIALVSLMLVLLTAAGMAEQMLPGVDVFSPGLIRLAEKMKDNPPVHMEAELSVANAFYVRDTSVLSAMLEGTTIVYDGAQGENGPVDRLRIVRGEETLFDAQKDDAAIAVNGEAFAFEEAMDPRVSALLDFVQRTAVLERAPLAQVEAFLLSLNAGDALLAGYAVETPFACVRTMSDDGTRLVRINISGSIAKEGEAPWEIKGYLKQPAGRAPKDTFELTATQDEKNYLELSYSSLRQSEITKKNKAGKASVDTHVKIAGEIGGYRVSERLTSLLRNTWSADGENLSEKIVVNMTLEHSDNTPGREMQRMNKAEAKMRHDIRMTTADAGNDVIELTDAVTVSLVMDENTVLDAGAGAAMRVGGEAAVIKMPAVQESGSPEEAPERAAQDIARRVYAQLGDKMKAKIMDGLEP
ncbi:MAG: hypothetical protein IKV90_01070 [Clostridia bacterium]|nr:hypothetical protein [Clostridia bacterium]